MGINVEIWVNKKEVVDKIKRLDFWDLMFHLDNLRGIRYYRLQEVLGNDITSLQQYSREDINKWVLKYGLLKLSKNKDLALKDLVYLFNNLTEFIIIPDEVDYESDELISVGSLIEEFESKIEQ